MLTSVFCKSIHDPKVNGGPRIEVKTLSQVDYPKDLSSSPTNSIEASEGVVSKFGF